MTWLDMNAPAYGTWLEIPTVRNRRQYLQQPTDFFSNWLRPSPVEEIEHFRRTTHGVAAARTVGSTWIPRPCRLPAGQATLAEMPPPEEPAGASCRPLDGRLTPPRHSGQANSGTSTRLTIELAAGIKMRTCANPARGIHPRRSVRLSRRTTGWSREHHSAVLDRRVRSDQRTVPAVQSAHDSGSEPMLWLKWHPGHFVSLNQPRQPVCRVSWEEAGAFCRWLSQQTGRKFALPDESQWEWACRAGTDTPWSFGDRAADCTTSKTSRMMRC